MEYTGILENWYNTSWYGKEVVIGKIYEDYKKRFDDGTRIHTSPIIELNEQEGWVKTINSLYKLGTKRVFEDEQAS